MLDRRITSLIGLWLLALSTSMHSGELADADASHLRGTRRTSDLRWSFRGRSASRARPPLCHRSRADQGLRRRTRLRHNQVSRDDLWLGRACDRGRRWEGERRGAIWPVQARDAADDRRFPADALRRAQGSRRLHTRRRQLSKNTPQPSEGCRRKCPADWRRPSARRW